MLVNELSGFDAKMRSYSYILLLTLAAAVSDAKLGVRFEKRASSLPILTLPYGQFQASSYNSNAEVCTSRLLYC